MECTSLTPEWFADILRDARVTDVCVNSDDGVFVDRGNGMERQPCPTWPEDEIRKWVVCELSRAGKSWDAKHPFADATLYSEEAAHRLHVCFPPITPKGILLSLRRLASTHPIQIGPSRWTDSPYFAPLLAKVQAGDSVLISGATGTGKTTLASDLLSRVNPIERIIALEDTAELRPNHPHFLSLVSRPANADGCGEVSLRTLLRQSLRMRPDRIVLGECRGSEVLDLLQALNTGHQGSLTTLHANSPRDALRRIELLCMIASEGKVSSSVIRELLSVGIQWVVQLQRKAGQRKISEMWRVEGREGDTILMRQMVETEAWGCESLDSSISLGRS